MSTDNRLAKDRIINALGDLYRVKRHSNKMSAAQKANVDASIDALEAEYLELLGVDTQTASYSVITAKFRNAKSGLDQIKEDREKLANKFVSASKLLGSLNRVLKLL